jgi:hypothetical protein
VAQDEKVKKMLHESVLDFLCECEGVSCGNQQANQERTPFHGFQLTLAAVKPSRTPIKLQNLLIFNPNFYCFLQNASSTFEMSLKLREILFF